MYEKVPEFDRHILALLGSIVFIYIIGTILEMLRQMIIRKITNDGNFKGEKKSV